MKKFKFRHPLEQALYDAFGIKYINHKSEQYVIMENFMNKMARVSFWDGQVSEHEWIAKNVVRRDLVETEGIKLLKNRAHDIGRTITKEIKNGTKTTLDK